jgi:class 3 adenylate cyclase/tetratricopeptide (TPR) repeat protein
MMNCPKCQADNKEEAKFCRKCGTKLSLLCPVCGSENLFDDKFCDQCGHALTEPVRAPSIDYGQPQSYTPKHLADKILTSRSSVEGERKLVTVLFADVANYTSISEKLDPEEVHQIMDGCFQILMDEIHRHEGTINQFTGDGVMALFGAPLAHEDHAQRACHAALSIQKAIGEYSESLNKQWALDFKMRIGLNSGPVVVGAIGDDLRMDYTAIGNTTNLAARMETMARPGTILVSSYTHRLAGDFFEFEPLGKVEVKGKEKAVDAFELIRAGEVETRIGASVARGLTRFVGRNNSMAALMEVYERFRSGSGQVVGIVGEAGVGKSRLLHELRNILLRDECTYLEGRCFHFGGSMAYLPILDILRSYFEIKEGDPEPAVKNRMEAKILGLDERLKDTLPPLQELLSLKVDNEAYLNLEPQQRRERTFEAIRDLLIRESQNRPLVLSVEDLHWIDKTSEEFLDYLIGWLTSTPILLILLYRPEYTHQWGSKSYYTKIGLNQLGTASSTELVEAILEGGEVVRELMELILNRAAGNPLFMEEIIHALLENGSIERKDKKYVLSRKFSEVLVPDTIQGIIAARMDRLEENLKRTIQVASVIGRNFAFRILQTIAGMQEELKFYLHHLQALELIHEKRLFPELEYIFKHALIQEVAYNTLLLRKRTEIHEEIGRAIEEIYKERLEEFYEILAHHYSRSENTEKAYYYLKLSGKKAARSHSLWEAFRFYREAIDVLNQMPETEANKREQIEVRLLLSAPMYLLGHPEDSLQILEHGERHAKEVGDERSLAIFLSKLGSYHVFKGERLAAIEYTEKAFQEAEKINDLELMAPISSELCTSNIHSGEFTKTVEAIPKIIALLEKTQRERDFFGTRYNVYSGICAHCGFAFALQGNFNEGKVFFEKALPFALEINALYCLGWTEFAYGHFFLTMGSGEDAVGHFQKSIGYLEEAEAIYIVGAAWSGLGCGFYLLDDLETACRYIEKGLKIMSDMGLSYWLGQFYWFLSMVYFESGDLTKALNCAEEASKLSEKRGERHWEGISKIWRGRILWKAETTGGRNGEESIYEGMKICEALKLKPYLATGYLFSGELYAGTGQRERALEDLKKAEVMFQEMGMKYWLTKTKEVLGRL